MAQRDIRLPDFSLEIANINRSKNTVTIKADKQFVSREVDRAFKPYKNLPYKFKPALEKMADYVRVKMIPDTFKQEGPGWRRLARRTVRERMAAGYGGLHPILRRTDDLYHELTKKSHPKHIEVIKTGKNSRIEIGGSSIKFVENQLGVRQQNLPARPMIPGTGFVPVSDRDRRAMRDVLRQAIKGRK